MLEVVKIDGRWCVRRTYSENAHRDALLIVSYRRKRDAEIAAQAIGHVLKVEVKIKNRHGVIIESNSYGNDPRSIKG